MILRNISADEYLVYVPEAELEFFQEITPPLFQLKTIEDLGSSYSELLYDAVASAGNSLRFGWYRQQFDKYAALIRASSSRLIIWDADCVPLTKLELFDSSGSPIYMSATENHKPYFDVILRLLGLQRTQSQSFVVPGFPISKTWVESFIRDIESKHGKPWFEAIISCVDFSLKSGFSETETLGTWVAHKHPHEWGTASYKWERRGQSRFGYAKKMTIRKLEKIQEMHSLAILSFENWDRRLTWFQRLWKRLR